MSSRIGGWKTIVFDMDGTLVDSSKGILDSHRFAARTLKLELPADSDLKASMGGPLLEVYTREFGLSLEAAKQAVEAYRDYYGRAGVRSVEPYPNLVECIKKLHASGLSLAVATLKRQDFAEQILSDLKIGKYFRSVHGTNANDSKGKVDCIRSCLSDLGVDAEAALMVGDSRFDLEAAEEVKMDFLAVTYGFGFKSSDELAHQNCIGTCNDMHEVWKHILHGNG